MARPIKQRKILSPHSEISFFPSEKSNSDVDNISFLAEEYEAIKLVDYEGLQQAKAAKFMQVSRPTITRIYKRERKKIATSLIENKPLKLSGENIYFSDNWHKCQNCESIYNVVEKLKNKFCPLCNSENFMKLENNK